MAKSLPKSPAKGVRPDGRRLKELRKKAGKTQKGLIQGSGVELRTYQRAESGQPILPEILQTISKILGVDPGQVRQGEVEPEQENSFRLYCVTSAGARRLIGDLQGWPSKIEHEFEINPTADVAEKVAEVVERCDTLWVKDFDRDLLSPAARIRAIGQLNDKLVELAGRKVFTYAGTYYTWTVAEEISSAFTWASGNPIEYKRPSTESNLRLVFSHHEHPFIVGTYSSWQSQMAAHKRAIAANLSKQIKPDWINASFFDDGFEDAYREAYAQSLLAAAPQLQLSAPIETEE